MILENTLVMLYAKETGQKFFITVTPGEKFSSHFGIVAHDVVMEAGFGEMIKSHKDKEFLIIRPSLYDIMMNIHRHTQIIYPKDVGYILLKLGVRCGDRIIEAGTGSGSLTLSLAYGVMPEGKVYTYEKRPEFSEKAEKNLLMAGIRPFVEMKVADVEETGFVETNVDSVFLDMREPALAIDHAYDALRPGGTLGLLLPTANQVSEALARMETRGYVEIEALETFFRHYKINPARLRPEDRMVGHTGYLIFGRKGF